MEQSQVHQKNPISRRGYEIDIVRGRKMRAAKKGKVDSLREESGLVMT